MYEGERKFDIRIRYQPEFRYSENQIQNLLVPTLNNSEIPLKEIAEINWKPALPLFTGRTTAVLLLSNSQ